MKILKSLLMLAGQIALLLAFTYTVIVLIEYGFSGFSAGFLIEWANLNDFFKGIARG